MGAGHKASMPALDLSKKALTSVSATRTPLDLPLNFTRIRKDTNNYLIQKIDHVMKLEKMSKAATTKFKSTAAESCSNTEIRTVHPSWKIYTTSVMTPSTTR